MTKLNLDKELLALAAAGVEATWEAIAPDLAPMLSTDTLTAAELCETVSDHVYLYASKDEFAAYELLKEAAGGFFRLVPELAAALSSKHFSV